MTVDRRTFAQHAYADCTYRLTWPGVDVTVASTMRVDVTAGGYDVTIEAEATDGEQVVAQRAWTEHIRAEGGCAREVAHPRARRPPADHGRRSHLSVCWNV